MDDNRNLLTEVEVRAKMVAVAKELSRQERRLATHRLPQWPELEQQK